MAARSGADEDTFYRNLLGSDASDDDDDPDYAPPDVATDEDSCFSHGATDDSCKSSKQPQRASSSEESSSEDDNSIGDQAGRRWEGAGPGSSQARPSRACAVPAWQNKGRAALPANVSEPQRLFSDQPVESADTLRRDLLLAFRAAAPPNVVQDRRDVERLQY